MIAEHGGSLRRRSALAAISSTLTLLPACGIDERVIVEEKPPPGSWTSFGGNLAHTRFNVEERQIDRESVAAFAERWHVDAPGVTSTPAVWGDTVYWADWGGGVHATRAADGSEIWTQTIDKGSSSSPCVTGNHVYVSNRTDTVHAFDRATGGLVWLHRIASTPHARLWSSPVVSKGVLVIGLAGIGTQMDGQPLPDEQLSQFRGAVVALNAYTGTPLWRFETTRGPDGEEYGAGVSVWSSASVDDELDLVFIGTGNSYFKPASPFSDSLLALRRSSGELVWHRQFTEGDAFRAADRSGGPDFDVGAAPNLFEVAGRRIVGVGDKGGSYRALDRRTGEFVWQVKLTQGSGTGGVVAPAVVSNGVVYVISNESITQSFLFALRAADGSELFRKPFGSLTFGAPALAGGVLFAGSATADVFAISEGDGADLWKGRVPQDNRGGGFSISGGLVFVGSGFHFYRDSTEPIAGSLVAFGAI